MLLLATELGIDKKRISPLHPQANGAVERLNRTIGQMLRKTQEDNDWDLKIPFVRFNYLNQEHSSTGYSPFFLTYGRHPRTPVLINNNSMSKPKTPQKWATDLAKTLKEAHNTGADQDKAKKEKRIESGMSASTKSRFKVNDKVLVYSPQKKGQAKTLHKAWQGPYIVIQCREGNTYRVKKADNFRKRFIRHHDQLQLFHTRPRRLRNPIQIESKEQTEKDSTTLPTQGSPLVFEEWDDESEGESDSDEEGCSSTKWTQ